MLVGLHGDAGVFSFYPVKHMTTAEGGMIILRDEDLAKKLKLLRAFGVNRNYGERKIPGMYDTEVLGFNFRMSEIHAAIGVEQIKKLPFFLKKRKENFDYLELGLKNLDYINVLAQPVNQHLHSSHYCLGMMIDDTLKIKRPIIMDALGKKGVGTSIYYPQPVPRMSYYKKKYGYDESDYINAATISDSIIALPVGPHLNLSDMDYIVKSIKQILGELSV
jgi:dTDP-4-amino-4,6-dideoxygalactose transaminase